VVEWNAEGLNRLTFYDYMFIFIIN